ncbi:GntR family transcriptional regulator [Sagittula sp. SSi028]|uniref:GntR family transcriptional regulator n=1 Tax=Sagittula sp. SSi028 TaxID=3400636 RepID=UPI003AF58052
MLKPSPTWTRRGSVDRITHALYHEILTLKLLPGAKISEADVAQRFGVSRQPVRDAFTRLANLDLLLIRPQKATEVRKFSMRAIAHARLIRLAVEAEMLRRAAERCTLPQARSLDRALADQRDLLACGDYPSFSKLDYAFHKTLCHIAEADDAFDVIQTEKAKVDRLCMLGLAREDRMPDLVDDHAKIAEAVKAGAADEAVAALRAHLARLDGTIDAIFARHPEFFDGEDR